MFIRCASSHRSDARGSGSTTISPVPTTANRPARGASKAKRGAPGAKRMPWLTGVPAGNGGSGAVRTVRSEASVPASPCARSPIGRSEATRKP